MTPDRTRPQPTGKARRDKNPLASAALKPPKNGCFYRADPDGTKTSGLVPSGKKVVLYARVSTDGGRQSVLNQIAELSAVADRLNWNVVEIITDEASGTKGRAGRPGYDRLMTMIGRREIDLVAAWGADRIARSLSELVGFLAEVQSRSVDIYLHRQSVDTSTPAGRALFQMLGVFAEFERALIIERVRAGLQRARSEGKHIGRPSLPESVRAQIERELRRGTPVRAIARKTKVAPVTVRRVRNEMREAML